MGWSVRRAKIVNPHTWMRADGAARVRDLKKGRKLGGVLARPRRSELTTPRAQARRLL